VGEYIRDGLVWSEWIENFKSGMFLIDQFGDDALVFDVTLTTPGLFHLDKLIDVASSLDIKSYFKFTYAFDPSVVMSPFCLPKDVLLPQVDSLMQHIDERLTWKTKVYKDSLVNLINRESFDEQWPDTYKDGLKRGKQFQEYLDDLRKSKLKFVDTLHGNAVDWWNKI